MAVYEFTKKDPKIEKLKAYASQKGTIINHLLWTANYFLRRAHESVLYTKKPAGGQTYSKLIFLSIKSLLMLLKKYRNLLSPSMESSLCIQLAQIYFVETDNTTRAEDYAQRALSIAMRNNLKDQLFLAEFLVVQILDKMDSPMLGNFLNTKIEQYGQTSPDVVSIFQLMKCAYLIKEDFAEISGLQRLCYNDKTNKSIKILATLFQVRIHLRCGSPQRASELLEDVKFDLNSFDCTQLRAMYLLSAHLIACQCNDRQQGKLIMSEIGAFILDQQEKKKWSIWNEDGTFNMSLNDQITFTVRWLNSDEFVIVFYFLTAVSLMPEGNERAAKVFKRCLDIIKAQTDQLDGVTIGSRSYSLDRYKFLSERLAILQGMVSTYQVLHQFSCHNFDLELLSSLKSTIQPLNYYLYGLYYQKKGNVIEAKKYFIKVREYEPVRDKIEMYLPLREGKYNELYVFASLHLLILVEQNRNVQDDELHELRRVLYRDLESAFSSKTKNFTSSPLVRILYQLLYTIFEGQDFPMEESDLEMISKNYPFVACLVHFISTIKSTNLEKRNDHFKRSMKLAEKMDCPWLKVLILEERLKEIDDNLIRSQINELKKSA